MRDMATLIKRGASQPSQILPFVLGKVFPRSRWSGVDYRDEFITFRVERGSFVQGASTPPEFCARQYLDISAILELVGEFGPDDVAASLEVGCGYGRLTPWLSTVSGSVHGVDPNEDVLAQARRLYPQIEFRSELAQDLSYPDGAFDLVVSLTTLHHIPPDRIEGAAAEIRRVLAPGGLLVVGEQTASLGRDSAWGRPESEYERLFDPLELRASRPRPVEPTFDAASEPARLDEATGLTYHPHERFMTFSRG